MQLNCYCLPFTDIKVVAQVLEFGSKLRSFDSRAIITPTSYTAKCPTQTDIFCMLKRPEQCKNQQGTQ